MLLGFATYSQELGSKTVGGFVPNGSNAAKKSRDRTEPIVGAKVLRSFVQRFGLAREPSPLLATSPQSMSQPHVCLKPFRTFYQPCLT
jgi:hypothetical protein